MIFILQAAAISIRTDHDDENYSVEIVPIADQNGEISHYEIDHDFTMGSSVSTLHTVGASSESIDSSSDYSDTSSDAPPIRHSASHSSEDEIDEATFQFAQGFLTIDTRYHRKNMI